MSDNEDLKLDVRLIFWQLFQTGLQYENLHSEDDGSIRKLLEPHYKVQVLNVEKRFPYSEKRRPYYEYEDIFPIIYSWSADSRYKERVKWLAPTAYTYMPIVVNLAKERFSCPNEVKGTIKIEAHLHYGGCLLFDCKLDYDDYYSVKELVRSSQPKDIKLESADKSLQDFFEKKKKEIISITKNAKGINKATNQTNSTKFESPNPWHHTWIIKNTNVLTKEDLELDTWQRDFEKGGKYFKHAVGLSQREDNWDKISVSFFAQEMENLSPYENSVVYVTNAGNVIIPNKALLTPISVKNKLVDIIFATEMGNVQRFLCLIHVNQIANELLRMKKEIEARHTSEKSDNLVEIITECEERLNLSSLEIIDDLMISKVRRLMFTSILKLRLFDEMIKSLHGDEYDRNLESLLSQMQRTITREREIESLRISEKEKKLLKNLQLVFIITLAAQIISLYFYDPNLLYLPIGFGLLILSIILAAIIYLGILYGPKIRDLLASRKA